MAKPCQRHAYFDRSPVPAATSPSSNRAGQFDEPTFTAALAFYGHTRGNVLAFRKIAGTLERTNPSFSSRAGFAVYVPVNTPKPECRTKPAIADIAIVQNIYIDGEYPPEPHRALNLAVAWRDELARHGLIDAGLPIENTGAGFHLVIPIAPIATSDVGGPEIANEAVSAIVKRYLLPPLDQIAAAHGLPAGMGECYDIARITSMPGTWRPGGSKKGEAPCLAGGFLRRWLPPYDAVPPVRVESALLTTLITTEAQAIQQRKLEVLPPAQEISCGIHNLAPAIEVEAWVKHYAAEHCDGQDRSDDFHRLVIATYLKFGPDVVRNLAMRIDELAGNKYGARAKREAERSLQKAPSRTDIAPHSTVEHDQKDQACEAEIERLRAEIARLERESAAKDRQIAEQQDRIDELVRQTNAAHRFITELKAGSVRDAMAQGAKAKALEHAMSRVLTDTSMGYKDRVVTALAIRKTEAYVAPMFGEEPPEPEPRRLVIWSLAEDAGAPESTISTSLRLAEARGHVIRTTATVNQPQPDGTVVPRLHVFLQPGTGRIDHAYVDKRRLDDRGRKQEERDAQVRHEAELLAENAMLRQAAATAAQTGCPSCGGELLPTGYICTECRTIHTPVEIMAAPPCGIHKHIYTSIVPVESTMPKADFPATHKRKAGGKSRAACTGGQLRLRRVESGTDV